MATTTIGQYIYNVLDTVSGKTITTTDFDPTKKVSGNFTKLSFQAPTGVKITIDGKAVIVGRSGYYEVPEGITVKEFIMEAGMIYTPAKSNEIKNALETLSNTVSELNTTIKNAKNDVSIIVDNNQFEEDYQKYQDALEAEPIATVSVPLENIIIDYVIESQDGAQVVDNSSVVSSEEETGGEN